MIQAPLREPPAQEEAYDRQTKSNGAAPHCADRQPPEPPLARVETPTDAASGEWQALDVNWDGLSGAQNIALVALTGGRTKAEAARIAGVHRNTLYRWLGEPEFRESLQRAHCELREAAQARLYSLADQAVGCIQVALERGDARTALQLVKMLGTLDEAKPPKPAEQAKGDADFFSPLPEDSDDPDVRAERQRLERLIQFERDRQTLLKATALCVGLVAGGLNLVCCCLLGLVSLLARCWGRLSALLGCLGNAVVDAARQGWLALAFFMLPVAGQAVAGRPQRSCGGVRYQAELGNERCYEEDGERDGGAKGRFAGLFVPCFALLRRAARLDWHWSGGNSLRLAT